MATYNDDAAKPTYEAAVYTLEKSSRTKPTDAVPQPRCEAAVKPPEQLSLAILRGDAAQP